MNNLLIEAYKAQVAELTLARQQASEMVGLMMDSRLSDEQRDKLFEAVTRHLQEIEDSRSAHLSAVIRTTLLGLNSMAQQTADQKIKQQMIEMIKALNIAVGHEEAIHKENA